ncbi:MAG: VWA domain-containing protein [Tetrasphaera sp.]|nr:VWA domain-containing protein [Tetrasphaera sp.]
MTDADLTHGIYFLLGRSRIDAVDQVGHRGQLRSAFLEGQLPRAPGRCRVTLAQFDDTYEVVYADRDVATSPLVPGPRNTAALLDSISRLVTDAGRPCPPGPSTSGPAPWSWRSMTDGMENASREWTHTAVRIFIEQQERDYQWQFLYLRGGPGCHRGRAQHRGGCGQRADAYGRGASGPHAAASAWSVAGARPSRPTGGGLSGLPVSRRTDSAG